MFRKGLNFLTGKKGEAGSSPAPSPNKTAGEGTPAAEGAPAGAQPAAGGAAQSPSGITQDKDKKEPIATPTPAAHQSVGEKEKGTGKEASPAATLTPAQPAASAAGGSGDKAKGKAESPAATVTTPAVVIPAAATPAVAGGKGESPSTAATPATAQPGSGDKLAAKKDSPVAGAASAPVVAVPAAATPAVAGGKGESPSAAATPATAQPGSGDKLAAKKDSPVAGAASAPVPATPTSVASVEAKNAPSPAAAKTSPASSEPASITTTAPATTATAAAASGTDGRAEGDKASGRAGGRPRSPKKSDAAASSSAASSATRKEETGPIAVTDVKAVAACLDALRQSLAVSLGDKAAVRVKLHEIFDAIARAAGRSLGSLEEDEFSQALASLKTGLADRQASAIFHYYRRPDRPILDYRRFLVDAGLDRTDAELVDSLQSALQDLMETEPALSTKLSRFFSEYDFDASARQRAEALGRDRGQGDTAELRAFDKAELDKFKTSVAALGVGLSEADVKRLMGALRRQGPAGADGQTVLQLVTAHDSHEVGAKGHKAASLSSHYASAIVDKFTPRREEQYKASDREAPPKGIRPTAEVVWVLREAVKQLRSSGVAHISPWVLLHSLLTPTPASPAPAAAPAETSASMGVEIKALAALFARFDPQDAQAQKEQQAQDQPAGAFGRLAAAANLTHGELQRAVAWLNRRAEESKSSGAGAGPARAGGSAAGGFEAVQPSSTVLSEAAAMELFSLSRHDEDSLALGQVRYTLREALGREQRVKLGYATADGAAKPEWTEDAVVADVAAKSDYYMRFSLKADDDRSKGGGWAVETKPCLVAASGTDLVLSLAPGDVPCVPLRGLGVSFDRAKWSVLVEVYQRPKVPAPAPAAVPAAAATAPAGGAAASAGTPVAAASAASPASPSVAAASSPAASATPSAAEPPKQEGDKKEKGGDKPKAAEETKSGEKGEEGKKSEKGDKVEAEPAKAASEPVRAPPKLLSQLALSLGDVLSAMLGEASFLGGWLDVYLWSQIAEYAAQTSFVGVSAAAKAAPAVAQTVVGQGVAASPAAAAGPAPATTPSKGAAAAPTSTPTAVPASASTAPVTPAATTATAATAATPSGTSAAPTPSPSTSTPAAARTGRASDPREDRRADRLQCLCTLQSIFAGRGTEGALGNGMPAPMRQDLSMSLQEFVSKRHFVRSPPSERRLQLRHSALAPTCSRSLAQLAVELVSALLVTPAPKPVPDEPLKPVNPRTAARNRAKKEGHLGGKAVLSLAEAAVIVQAAWRSKVVRRHQRKQHWTAIVIQRIFRGTRQRRRFLASKGRLLELQLAEATRDARLRRIRAKERELAMLRRIPPEEYLHYERLRRDHSARLVQRSWRRLHPHHIPSRPVSRAAAEADESSARRRQLDAKQAALEAHRRRVLTSVSAAAASASKYRPSDAALKARVEVDALGLAQLHSRIKDAAQAKAKAKSDEAKGLSVGTVRFNPREATRLPSGRQRVEYESAANEISVASRGCVRRRYQDLAEVQHRAAGMCDEYAALRSERQAAAAQRLQRLSQTSLLLEQLSKCPTLDQGRDMIAQAERDGLAAPEWLRGLPTEALDKAVEAHFRTTHSMADTGTWCLVAAPYDVTGPPIDMAKLSGQEESHGAKGRAPGPMRARSGRWAAGDDTEQSLWWVSYATQRSKYAVSSEQRAALNADADDAMADVHNEVTGVAELRRTDRIDEDGEHVASAAETARARTNAALGIVNGSDLLKRVTRDVLAAPRRLEAVRAQCASENKRVDALAAVYAQQVLAMQTRQRHEAKRRQLSAHEVRVQEQAAVKIQAQVRRRRAAARAGALGAERRVGRALQVLLQELSKQQGGQFGSGQLGSLLNAGVLGLAGKLPPARRPEAKGDPAFRGKGAKSGAGLPFPPSGGTPSRPAYSGSSRNMYIKPSPTHGRPSPLAGGGTAAASPGGESVSTLDMSLTPGTGGRYGARSSSGKENDAAGRGGAGRGGAGPTEEGESSAASAIQRLYRTRSPAKQQQGGAAAAAGSSAKASARREDRGALAVSFEGNLGAAHDDSRGSLDSPLSMASADPRLTGATPGGYSGMGYVSSPSETMSQSQVSLTLFASPAGKRK